MSRVGSGDMDQPGKTRMAPLADIRIRHDRVKRSDAKAGNGQLAQHVEVIDREPALPHDGDLCSFASKHPWQRGLGKQNAQTAMGRQVGRRLRRFGSLQVGW